MICPNCKKEIDDDSIFCGECSFKLKDNVQVNQDITSEIRYPKLRKVSSWIETIATVDLVITWIVGIGLILISLGFLSSNSNLFGGGIFSIFISIIWILFGYLRYVIECAIAELLVAIGDMADNSWVLRDKALSLKS